MPDSTSTIAQNLARGPAAPGRLPTAAIAKATSSFALPQQKFSYTISLWGADDTDRHYVRIEWIYQRINPNHGRAHYGLGSKVLLSLGQNQAGVESLRKYLTFDQTGNLAEDAKREIEWMTGHKP